MVLDADAEDVVAEAKITMSRAEWMHRFHAMVAAGAFREEQRRILASAFVDDEDEPLGGVAGPIELTSQQFADHVQLMLAANPSLLNEETSAELVRVFTERNVALRLPDTGFMEVTGIQGNSSGSANAS